jgi:hypothetical protein
MIKLSATRCSCIAILWVSQVSFAAITFFIASQWVCIFVIVYFVTDSVRRLLDTPSYNTRAELFCVVTPWSDVVVRYQRFREPCSLKLHPEDGGSMDLRNVGILPQQYTASHRVSTRIFTVVKTSNLAKCNAVILKTNELVIKCKFKPQNGAVFKGEPKTV